MATATRPVSPSEERLVRLAPGAALIPERLLLAHARGRSLLITGAGTSLSSGLPDFRKLVLQVYEELDNALFIAIDALPSGTQTLPADIASSFSTKQRAEANRFLEGQYDVALGMLERRMETADDLPSRVREVALRKLRTPGVGPLKPSAVHKGLMRIADRGAATTIATTNFDLLLEQAGGGARKVPSFALGAIPRPTARADFGGVLHIHGAMPRVSDGRSEIVVTDRDFGEYYLRRRVVPDFIYDAARLYCLVLVGYSVSDAPMRYLLNAVAADGSRFTDLRERFAFVGMAHPFNEVELEDWRGRGITPIPYDSNANHLQLTETLSAWAATSAINGSRRHLDALVKRLVRRSRSDASDEERDLFDHLYRRGAPNERARISHLASKVDAGVEWLDAMSEIEREPMDVQR